MSATIRCVKNCYLTVTKDGETKEELFPFGKWYVVERVEEIDANYINVIFSDGSAIAGVQRTIFELCKAPIVPASQVDDLIELQDAPPDEPSSPFEKPLRLPVDIIGNKDIYDEE